MLLDMTKYKLINLSVMAEVMAKGISFTWKMTCHYICQLSCHLTCMMACQISWQFFACLLACHLTCHWARCVSRYMYSKNLWPTRFVGNFFCMYTLNRCFSCTYTYINKYIKHFIVIMEDPEILVALLFALHQNSLIVQKSGPILYDYKWCGL
jgi:hypothetical protein